MSLHGELNNSTITSSNRCFSILVPMIITIILVYLSQLVYHYFSGLKRLICRLNLTSPLVLTGVPIFRINCLKCYEMYLLMFAFFSSPPFVPCPALVLRTITLILTLVPQLWFTASRTCVTETCTNGFVRWPFRKLSPKPRRGRTPEVSRHFQESRVRHRGKAVSTNRMRLSLVDNPLLFLF